MVTVLFSRHSDKIAQVSKHIFNVLTFPWWNDENFEDKVLVNDGYLVLFMQLPTEPKQKKTSIMDEDDLLW